jgi:hypothetical protein
VRSSRAAADMARQFRGVAGFVAEADQAREALRQRTETSGGALSALAQYDDDDDDDE